MQNRLGIRFLFSFFQFSNDIRRIMYTTYIIEGLNRQYRKVTKTKSVFPSDPALEKMLYLASENVVKKDIFYSAVLKIIKHPKPELAGFICACCDAEDIFVSLHCNAKNYIRSTTQDSAILTYFIMNTVHKDKRINRVQRTGLYSLKST